MRLNTSNPPLMAAAMKIMNDGLTISSPPCIIMFILKLERISITHHD